MTLSNRHALVTGGVGFIGSHLAERLLADGADVTVVDDCSNGDRDRIPDAATFVEADLTEPDALEGRFEVLWPPERTDFPDRPER